MTPREIMGKKLCSSELISEQFFFFKKKKPWERKRERKKESKERRRTICWRREVNTKNKSTNKPPVIYLFQMIPNPYQ